MTASWAWLALAAIIICFVVAYDCWAHFTGNATMSGQFHHWLTSSTWGGIAVAIWVGVPVGLFYHFTIVKGK